MEDILTVLSALSWVPGCIGLWFVWKQLKTSNTQTSIMSEQNKIVVDNVKREKAIEVAKEYAKMIDNELGFVSAYLGLIYKELKLEKVKFSQVEHFDLTELKTLFTTEEKKAYNEAIHSPNSKQMEKLGLLYVQCHDVTEAEMNDILNCMFCDWQLQNNDKENEELSDEIEKLNTKKNITNLKKRIEKNKKIFFYKEKIKKKLSSDITYVLNSLEYMTMNFTTNMADDEIIYQSIHQSFISTILLLYIHIAQLNERESDKYYCHLIKMYNLWKEKYILECREEDDMNRNKKKIPDQYY